MDDRSWAAGFCGLDVTALGSGTHDNTLLLLEALKKFLVMIQKSPLPLIYHPWTMIYAQALDSALTNSPETGLKAIREAVEGG